MYLFKKNNNSMDIFSLKYNHNELSEFKKEKMKKIPDNEKILCGCAIDASKPKEDFMKDKDRLYIPVDARNTKEFYLLNSKVNEKIKNFTLDSYYNDSYKNLTAYKSRYLKVLKYYLIEIINPKHTKDRKNFGNIIQTPEELYYLQLILNEQFKLLNDCETLNDVFDLFTLEKIDEINIEKLTRVRYGINKNNIKAFTEKAKNDEILIKKITRK